MRKFLGIFLSVCVTLFTLSAAGYASANTNHSISEKPITVILNDNVLNFDQPPVIEHDRTLVPVRAIFEALGALVIWDENTMTATGTKDDIKIEIQLDSNIMRKNGVNKILDVPARIINKRTLVPIRAISESFDCDVDWDEETRTVKITSENTANNYITTEAGTIITEDCQDISHFTITNTSEEMESIDTNSYIMGTQSLRCDGKMICTSNTYDLTKNNLVLKLKVNSLSKGASIMLDLKTAGKAPHAQYRLVIGNSNTTFGEWYEIAIPTYVYSYADSNVDFSNISSIQINVSGGTGDWNLQYIGIKPRQQKNAIISFTFDDGYKSQYLGAKILAEKGIASTVYHIPNNGKDCLTAEECREMIANFGTDFEAHGPTNYTKLTDRDLIEYWTSTQKYFKDNELGDCKHVAYPNGGHNEHIIELAKDFFISARTINGNIFAETQPPADNYRLRAVTGVGTSGVSVEKTKQYIDMVVNDKSWLILVFHQIEKDGENGCTESDLRELADYAIKSGADIMNIAEVFNMLVDSQDIALN